MAYRSSAIAAPPRVLVVRPQRAPTSAVFVVMGLGFVAVCLYGGWEAALEGTIGRIFGCLVATAFASSFVVIGVHSWFLRVEFRLHDDGVLTLTWRRWPFASKARTVDIADVRNVTIDTDDGSSKIVVLVGDEQLPLTSSATSDNLEPKVAELRAFLGVPRAIGQGAVES